MQINSINAQDKQNFGKLQIKGAKSFEKYTKNVFAGDEKGYKKFQELLEQIKDKHSKNRDYDICLFANDSAKKETLEAMIMYKPLKTMVGWIRSTDAPFKNMISQKNMITKFVKTADLNCPTEPFHI